MSNFIEKCVNNEVSINDIDDYVTKWHEGDSKLSLRKYLGMSDLEYKLWLCSSSSLERIIERRKIQYLNNT